MRPATTLSLAVLAACATVDAWSRTGRGHEPFVPPSGERAAVARQRGPSAIAGPVAPRAIETTAAVTSGLADSAVMPHGQDPTRPAAPEPRYIDQREPPRGRLREAAAPPMAASLRLGFGVVDARVADRLDDRTEAAFVGLDLEAAVASDAGVGISVEWWGSDSDLFAGKRTNDGIDPVAADASHSAVDACVYYHRDALTGDLRLPWRVGLFTDLQSLDQELAPVERDWLSTGVRIIAEPTWRVCGDDQQALELVGRFGGDVGATWFREHYRNGGDRDTTWRWSGEVGLAARAVLGNIELEIGYRLTHVGFGEIDTDLFGEHDRCGFRRQQGFVSLGASW
jgi:hypothetical protein